MLIEKSENDDRYIMALKKEVDKLKSHPQSVQTRIVYKDRPVEVRKNEADDSDSHLVIWKSLLEA